MATFSKLGKCSEDIRQTWSFEGNTCEAQGVLNVELTVASRTTPIPFLSLVERDHTSYCSEGIEFTPIITFRLGCIRSCFNGKVTKSKSWQLIQLSML
jgi:hypothetical protein